MEIGTVCSLRLDKGYGFIHANGRDVFMHFKALDDGLPWDETLMERRVQFTTEQTPKGERAVRVRAAI